MKRVISIIVAVLCICGILACVGQAFQQQPYDTSSHGRVNGHSLVDQDQYQEHRDRSDAVRIHEGGFK